ncbi:MAG: hypothetical protein O9310_00100 [Leptospiraceae bacterium]|nr:hypothetical protein [Leptospiraceae bacterium]
MNEILLFTFSVFFLLVFWNYYWKRYVLDSFREELFSIRARLFDFALENKGFSFSDELYITFELILNGTIRFGHNVSLLNALTFGLLNQLTFPGFKIESKLHQNFRACPKTILKPSLE